MAWVSVAARSFLAVLLFFHTTFCFGLDDYILANNYIYRIRNQTSPPVAVIPLYFSMPTWKGLKIFNHGNSALAASGSGPLHNSILYNGDFTTANPTATGPYAATVKDYTSRGEEISDFAINDEQSLVAVVTKTAKVDLFEIHGRTLTLVHEEMQVSGPHPHDPFFSSGENQFYVKIRRPKHTDVDLIYVTSMHSGRTFVLDVSLETEDQKTTRRKKTIATFIPSLPPSHLVPSLSVSNSGFPFFFAAPENNDPIDQSGYLNWVGFNQGTNQYQLNQIPYTPAANFFRDEITFNPTTGALWAINGSFLTVSNVEQGSLIGHGLNPIANHELKNLGFIESQGVTYAAGTNVQYAPGGGLGFGVTGTMVSLFGFSGGVVSPVSHVTNLPHYSVSGYQKSDDFVYAYGHNPVLGGASSAIYVRTDTSQLLAPISVQPPIFFMTGEKNEGASR